MLRPRRRGRAPVWRRSPLILLALLFVGGARQSVATGYFGPTTYLDEGGRRVTESPEFYWELEVKRLAHDFHPPEKLLVRPKSETDSEEGEGMRVRLEQLAGVTAEIDEKDFEAALQDGHVKPNDAAQAREQQKAARKAVLAPAAASLPAEFPSEFADYHRGAFAFRHGTEHWPEARQAWEALLARPPEERHYRTVWAAFMIGKLLLKSGDPEAVNWFERTRELARAGFKDSLGMAADSYGWQGRSEWKQGHPEKAAPLFLTQLALGDESAVISLKALIPDRQPVEGFVNYRPEPPEGETLDDAALKAQQAQELAALRVAVKDPLLRRLITTHILAVSADSFLAENSGRPGVKRTSRWLATVEEAKIGRTEDAEYLGWIAYQDGKYDQAARWLGLSGGETPAALWLQAKVQRRAGKLDDAVRSMAKAWENVRHAEAYTGWRSPDRESDGADHRGYTDGDLHWAFGESASGDLGGLRLARSEFVGALDAFLKGGLWSDAAFMAERVLTANELKTYVDQQPTDIAGGDRWRTERPDTLRYLLGRRLVREDRYEEAAPYLPPTYQKVLEHYVNALKDGADGKLPKEQRARAYFAAAWHARFDGMELMGTEGAPDAFSNDGNFEETDLAKERLAASYVHVSWDGNGAETKQQLPLALKPSAQEKERLAKPAVKPDVRYHYRIIAAALALRAADLLPDHSEELAEVLNEAGNWTSERDKKMAARAYNAIERRCADTTIGRAVMARRWFLEQRGPWSEEQKAAHDALVPPRDAGE